MHPSSTHDATAQRQAKRDRIASTALRRMSLQFAVALLLTFSSAMMQCSATAEVVEAHHSSSSNSSLLAQSTAAHFCKRQKCENGCSSLPVTHKTPHADLIANTFSLTTHDNRTTSCVCPQSCEHEIPLNCTIEEGKILQHEHEMKNPFDPCETFVCLNGKISIHMASCASIHCPVDQRMRLPNQCCEICDPNYSNFCEDDDCEWHCRYGYVFDEERGCDLCKCLKPPTTTARTTTVDMTSTTPSTTTEETDEQEKTFFVFLDDDNTLLNVLIVSVILMAVIASGIFFVFVIWLLHRRIYNRVPLISHGVWKESVQVA